MRHKPLIVVGIIAAGVVVIGIIVRIVMTAFWFHFKLWVKYGKRFEHRHSWLKGYVQTISCVILFRASMEAMSWADLFFSGCTFKYASTRFCNNLMKLNSYLASINRMHAFLRTRMVWLWETRSTGTRHWGQSFDCVIQSTINKLRKPYLSLVDLGCRLRPE